MKSLERQRISNDDGEFELWANEVYIVIVFRTGSRAEIRIQARDGSPRHDWQEFQQIKNDICGIEAEAIELYPAESRLRDPSNMYFLWCDDWSKVGWHLPRVTQ